MQRHWGNSTVQFRITHLHIIHKEGTQREDCVLSATLSLEPYTSAFMRFALFLQAEISKGIYMRKPSKVMIIRDLQEGLWQIVEPRIDSEAVTTDSHERIMRLAIQRFVEERAKSLSMAELADALDSLEQTAALFLEYLRSKGIVGDPIAVQ